MRNPVIPMARHAANLIRLNSNGSSPTYGVGAYSEGVSDDLNKVVWSLLAQEPDTTVEQAVAQYARYFFGADHEAAMARALFGLEENWVGDIANSTAAATLAILQSVEHQLTVQEIETNWRLQAYIYRAYFDATVQGRYLCEQARQEQAYTLLRNAPTTKGGSVAALRAARAALAGGVAKLAKLATHARTGIHTGAGPSHGTGAHADGDRHVPQSSTLPTAADACSPARLRTLAAWNASVYEYAAMINRTVGASVLQSQSADLNLARSAPRSIPCAPRST